jgi:hypothetical protein
MAVHIEVGLIGLALGFEEGTRHAGEGCGYLVRTGFDLDFEVEVFVDAAMILAGRRGFYVEAFDAGAVDEKFDVVGAGDAFDVFGGG